MAARLKFPELHPDAILIVCRKTDSYHTAQVVEKKPVGKSVLKAGGSRQPDRTSALRDLLEVIETNLDPHDTSLWYAGSSMYFT